METPLRHRWAVLLLIGLTLLLDLPGFSALPPMDRDEPRFAQASKQMLETGDFIDIRFQDEARNKKPVGIYWLQAAAVAAGEAVGVPDARRAIWLYRLPSLAGALAAVLATYWTALALASRRAALAGAALFAATVLLTAEARLATTDAVLCATVVVAMGSFVRVVLGQQRNGRQWLQPAVFWTAIAVGILLKGPITPMVPAFAAVVWCVRQRSAASLVPLRPALGLAWVAVLVLPWLTLILLRTHGAFLTEAVGTDMLSKTMGGREGHGAPPGTYLAVFWISAWPLAPIAALAAPFVWRTRKALTVSILLAWLVPTWLVFEIVPTKLPHYVLPVYPAVAILAAKALDEATSRLVRSRLASILTGALFAVLPLAVVGAVAAAKGTLSTNATNGTIVFGALAATIAAGCCGLAVRCLQAGAWPNAVALACSAAVVINAFTFGHLLTPAVSDLLALSPRLAAAGESASAPGCGPVRFASVSDHEPSLVFLTGTDLLLTEEEGAAGFIRGGPCRGVFVDRRAEPAFLKLVGDTPGVTLVRRLAGLDINAGKHLDIGIYVRQEGRR